MPSGARDTSSFHLRDPSGGWVHSELDACLPRMLQRSVLSVFEQVLTARLPGLLLPLVGRLFKARSSTGYGRSVYPGGCIEEEVSTPFDVSDLVVLPTNVYTPRTGDINQVLLREPIPVTTTGRTDAAEDAHQ